MDLTLDTFYESQIEFDTAYDAFMERLGEISGGCGMINDGLALDDLLYNTEACLTAKAWDEVIKLYEEHGWINKN